MMNGTYTFHSRGEYVIQIKRICTYKYMHIQIYAQIYTYSIILTRSYSKENVQIDFCRILFHAEI